MENISNLLTNKDIEIIEKKGISFDNIQKQYENFLKGAKKLELYESATIHNGGIIKLNDKAIVGYKKIYEKSQNKTSILKFVPASGAATRMFKELFAFLDSQDNQISDNIKNLLENINKLAFYSDLNDILRQENTTVEQELDKKNYKKIIDLIVSETGLNYGNLPKGLIKFHKYKDKNRTAFEEHIVESLDYATGKNGNNIHFTVSPEHQVEFEKLAENLTPEYEQKNNTIINIDFSIQKHSTDTIALTPDNKPFRDENGDLVFRPGGHGALIHNLNNLNYDLIFIKNIDNVAPDRIKENTCQYKKVLAGILLKIQEKSFQLIDLLWHNPSIDTINEAFDFLHNTLSVKVFFNFSKLSKNDKIDFLIRKLDRPIRVCGMVKNEGEPGGGPFFVLQKDQTATLQIVESAQLNLKDRYIKEIFERSTHFNPVDIVISPRRYNGEKFDLLNFVDNETYFISEKSLKGRELKALELPGLWNGAMANWNTVFVEVPIETFNPVKTIFDLLRPQHLSDL